MWDGKDYTYMKHTYTVEHFTVGSYSYIFSAISYVSINKGSVEIASLVYQSLTPEVKETLAGKMFSYSIINHINRWPRTRSAIH